MKASSSLAEVALLFLRLGATAFGGPAAHVAIMEDEIVRRRGWMKRGEFLDLLGATNLIPGPNSTELAIHIGRRRAGWTGLVVSGACFILPATLMVWALAWAYVRYGDIPASEGLLYGVKPVVLAVVVEALWVLGRTALKNRGLVVAGLAALGLALAGVNELIVLFGVGTAIVLVRRLAAAGRPFVAALPPPLVLATVAAAQPFHVPSLFLAFLKVGSVLFGSGYVLLAFLRAELVVRLGWLSEAQLLDAVAIGQMTPGPLFTTATFVGYVLGGHAGALAATLGIFLPAFFFVAVSGPVVPWLRRSAAAGAFLDGVNVASLALMAAVTVQLAGDAIRDAPAAVLALASGVLLVRFRINSSWLVAGGALLGILLAR
ncbi:MAG TPA: chromate efflux transporter [Vicinamibacteria bacterium]|nr:chromate efflux transporter [Vicinamibacteria bacterium]